jgi:hypothetical protein
MRPGATKEVSAVSSHTMRTDLQPEGTACVSGGAASRHVPRPRSKSHDSPDGVGQWITLSRLGKYVRPAILPLEPDEAG